MKKIGFFAIGFMLATSVTAQEKKDDFSSFMEEELASFDKFIDDANKDFINFLRDPWKEFEAERPAVKRTKPEPVTPVIYDKKTAPQNEKPTRLTIEEILDLSTTEGKQKPVTKTNDLDDINFDTPIVIEKEKGTDTIRIVNKKTIEKQLVTKPQQNEITFPPKTTTKTNQKTPIEADDSQQSTKPIMNNSTDQSPLLIGGAGRSKITYLTQTFYLPNDLKGKCRLKGLKEDDIADAYETMCNADYQPLLKDCKQIASILTLNDWGMFTLLRTIADSFCSNSNESVVMQQFLLNELGYKAKMARQVNADKMLLFVAIDCSIYGYPIFKLGGLTYYAVNTNQPCSFYMCEKDEKKKKNGLQMQLQQPPTFQGSTVRSIRQASNNGVKVTVDVPKTLIDFYKTYPQCDYSVYFNAPINNKVSSELLNALSPYIKGKSETEAANILINFVQTGFQYATDNEQFGYEKPFFVEELFYYPYCDCEDRSILYSYLVKNLLGLDVVLLDYPNHIATAVRFTENINGDYVIVNGQKYTVCDPTYIGANIGMTMPTYKNVSAKVLKY